jgi:hypothetical protein
MIDHFKSIDKRRKFSRKRPNEDTGDVTYINEKNRIFNKKVEAPSVCCSQHFADFSSRLPVTTTNIPQRYAPVSSVEQPYESEIYLAPLDGVTCIFCICTKLYCIITDSVGPSGEIGFFFPFDEMEVVQGRAWVPNHSAWLMCGVLKNCA